MAVINFEVRTPRKSDRSLTQQIQRKKPNQRAEIISLADKLAARGLTLEAPDKVEVQIRKDILLLNKEFFEILPVLDTCTPIRISSDLNGTGIKLSGKVAHINFYESLFNHDETFMEIYHWLRMNISMMAYAKEVTDYSIKYSSSPKDASTKYAHFNRENNGIDFWLEYRDGVLLACAQSPIQRYCKLAS